MNVTETTDIYIVLGGTLYDDFDNHSVLSYVVLSSVYEDTWKF